MSTDGNQFGILFDYNGVIVDDEHLQQESMGQAVEEYGVELTPELYVVHCLGRPDKAGFENLQQAFPALQKASVQQLIEQKTHTYQKLLAETSILYPGIKDVIQKLADEYRLVIVTGSLRAEVEPVLNREGITYYFQSVITVDDITKGKPDPEGYLKGVAALGLPKESIIVIEDAPSGVQAARNAGLKCIAVLHSRPQEELKDADLILPNIRQLSSQVIQETLAT